jgi:type I restriction enzyme S subunit
MIDGWKTYKLKELSSKIGSGATPRGGNEAYKSEGISLIRSQNILDFIFSTNGLAFIDEDQAAKLNNVEVQSRDVLLNITGDSVARVCQVPDELLPARVNQHVAIIRANQKLLNPDFLKYTLLSPNKKEYLLILASAGATRNAITKSMIEDFEISIPPIPEQTAIASILSALDDKIELNLQQNKTLEEMAMALYKHWFVDFGPFKDGNFIDSELGRIPEGWEVKSLNSLCEFSNGFAFKSTDLLKDEEEDCFHVFKMGHILKGGGLKSEGTKSWIKKEKCVKIEKYILKIGDILMSMTDMKDNMTILGHTALMNENNKFIVNQRVGLIRMKNSIEIDYPYIYITTNNKEYIEKLRSQANSGVQVNLSTDAIKNSKILAPSINVNSEFNVLVKPLFEKLNQNSIENQSLKEQRDSLLPKLISGEIKLKTFG